MSCLYCEGCERIIDSDYDTDCFVEDDEGFATWNVLCWWCREDQMEEAHG